MRYYGIYSERGLGVFISRSKLETALAYLPGACVNGFNSSKNAMDFVKRNYNLLIEQQGDCDSLFPESAEMRVNRTYYKNDLKGGKVNYEF